MMLRGSGACRVGKVAQCGVPCHGLQATYGSAGCLPLRLVRIFPSPPSAVLAAVGSTRVALGDPGMLWAIDGVPAAASVRAGWRSLASRAPSAGCFLAGGDAPGSS